MRYTKEIAICDHCRAEFEPTVDPYFRGPTCDDGYETAGIWVQMGNDADPEIDNTIGAYIWLHNKDFCSMKCLLSYQVNEYIEQHERVMNSTPELDMVLWLLANTHEDASEKLYDLMVALKMYLSNQLPAVTLEEEFTKVDDILRRYRYDKNG